MHRRGGHQQASNMHPTHYMEVPPGDPESAAFKICPKVVLYKVNLVTLALGILHIPVALHSRHLPPLMSGLWAAYVWLMVFSWSSLEKVKLHESPVKNLTARILVYGKKK
ncbi:hypothetical protein B0H13DRAFT_1889323 [Mycena leptocephala]|nr:hypothetical protein B0H13DRAFT_1889323 [Mycena leptocephala]